MSEIPTSRPSAQHQARPFIRWVGGKRALAKRILQEVPAHNRYIEPFAGGAAVFFELAPQRAVLSDVNGNLINAYKALQSDPDAVIKFLGTYENNESFYKTVREKQFKVGSISERAADFIYCLSVNFNGLYRENAKGHYNVPFGDNPGRTICDAENLSAVAKALQDVDLHVADFGDIAARAEAGDVCYFDPPYVPLSVTSSFTSYSAGGFGFADQVRLRDVALGLKNRGVTVILSNSSAPAVIDLYAPYFTIDYVDARRSVNSDASKRGPVKEVLIH